MAVEARANLKVSLHSPTILWAFGGHQSIGCSNHKSCLVLANFAAHIMFPIRCQRHVREGSEICEELIATDRLLGADDDHEDEDLIDPERLTYFQVVHININIA